MKDNFAEGASASCNKSNALLNESLGQPFSLKWFPRPAIARAVLNAYVKRLAQGLSPFVPYMYFPTKKHKEQGSWTAVFPKKRR